jgi:hypothetical protein
VPVHIQLTSSKYITVNGQQRSFEPGDWVYVGKQTARDWIAAGQAIDPFANMKSVEAPPGSVGMMLFGKGPDPDIKVSVSRDAAWEMRWEYTLFLDTTAPARRELIPAGFGLLKRWQMAVPLWDYRYLAASEGTEKLQERVKSIIHDLRVPLYDTRMIFAARCRETEMVMEMWQAEGGTRLAFLMALYRVKPFVRALPCTWTGQWAPTNA